MRHTEPRAQRRRAALQPLRARRSGGDEPPPEGDLTPLLVTYGGGACQRCVRGGVSPRRA